MEREGVFCVYGTDIFCSIFFISENQQCHTDEHSENKREKKNEIRYNKASITERRIVSQIRLISAKSKQHIEINCFLLFSVV